MKKKMTKLTKAEQDYWDELDRAVQETHAYWQVYLELFSDEKDYRFLRDVANVCFQMFDEAMYRFILLRLCSLCDPKESKVRNKIVENFSIPNFEATVARQLSEPKKIESKKKAFETACDPIRPGRNKLLAHLDKNKTMSGRQFHPSRDEVEICLRNLRELMTEFSKQLGVHQSDYDLPNIPGGGKDLLARLRG
jgi:hypothetical protein